MGNVQLLADDAAYGPVTQWLEINPIRTQASQAGT